VQSGVVKKQIEIIVLASDLNVAEANLKRVRPKPFRDLALSRPPKGK
jgi:hypothetical protein